MVDAIRAVAKFTLETWPGRPNEAAAWASLVRAAPATRLPATIKPAPKLAEVISGCRVAHRSFPFEWVIL